MLKEKGGAKKESGEKHKKISISARRAEHYGCAGLEITMISALALPKSSAHSTILEESNIIITVIMLAPTGGGKVRGASSSSPLVSVQDLQEAMSTFLVELLLN